ncbi:MAG: Asp-tRNA(Asn)/Glu-tRNA(Gln) amidotransferase subunit GatC [Planctomycetota bacterium]|jgi:aspartyl-tRNA(Asn)/glutamyl-tRNA(Gln) amidotransferase subunit C
MAIDRATVEHVARLARLEFAPDEIEEFASQLARIVDYVDKLKELDVSSDEPMAHAAHGALLREDVAGGSLPRKDALGGAPSAGGGFFRVPPVIDDAGSG